MDSSVYAEDMHHHHHQGEPAAFMDAAAIQAAANQLELMQGGHGSQNGQVLIALQLSAEEEKEREREAQMNQDGQARHLKSTDAKQLCLFHASSVNEKPSP